MLSVTPAMPGNTGLEHKAVVNASNELAHILRAPAAMAG